VFGVDSNYVNLGQFCRLPLSNSDMELARALSHDYKAMYSAAYSLLSAAAALRQSVLSDPFGPEEQLIIRKRICGILDRQAGKELPATPATIRRFISAVSCQGRVFLSSTVLELCKLICHIDNGLMGSSTALKIAHEEAVSRGFSPIVCPDPLDPERLEGLLLPELSLAFLSDDLSIDGARSIHIDKLISPDLRRSWLAEHRQTGALCDASLSLATKKLRRAKVLHDELEQIYRPYMDFNALDEFTAEQINRYIDRV